MNQQDWTSVVLKKKTTQAPLQTQRVTMTKIQRDALNADGEPARIEIIDKNISRRIQKCRADKGMTRKQLAQAISEKETVLANYENGKTIPNPAMLNKIEKVLGVSVRKD